MWIIIARKQISHTGSKLMLENKLKLNTRIYKKVDRTLSFQGSKLLRMECITSSKKTLWNLETNYSFSRINLIKIKVENLKILF